MSDVMSSNRIFNTIRTSRIFNASDSDVSMRSCDGILFRLHRKNLEAVTGAFQLSGLQTNDEIVNLSEPAVVLEIMFQFVYPRRNPTLENESPEVILAVAEAVEKYEVFPAMFTCEMRLLEVIATYPMRVMLHGLRHDYPKLINQSALAMCRRSSGDMVAELPPAYVHPWLKYQKAWKSLFSAIDDSPYMILESYAVNCGLYYPNEDGHEDSSAPSQYICRLCYHSLLSWRKELENKPTIEDLKSALAFLDPPPYNTSDRFCRKCSPRCIYMTSWGQKLSRSLTMIPPFTHYLSQHSNVATTTY